MFYKLFLCYFFGDLFLCFTEVVIAIHSGYNNDGQLDRQSRGTELMRQAKIPTVTINIERTKAPGL